MKSRTILVKDYTPSRKTHVAINDKGRRIGQGHPRAKLTDHEVDLIRELIDGGMSLRQIAAKFEVSKSQVHRIGVCEHRAQSPEDLVECPLEAPPRGYDASHGNKTDTDAGPVLSRVPDRPVRS